MKILHLSSDDKFLDQALPVFEKVCPGGNETAVFVNGKSIKNIKLVPNHIVIKKKKLSFGPGKLTKISYGNYDVIVIHSLNSLIYRELLNIPRDVPTIWLGWGYDYYSDFLSKNSLLLEATRKLYRRLEGATSTRVIYSFLRNLVLKFLYRRKKIRIIERMTIFAPVLPAEYAMVKSSREWGCFPDFGSWNYGTIEDDFINGFENEAVSGDAILIGNSATYTGNHTDAFMLLDKMVDEGRKLVVPLSYGDSRLAKELVKIGRDLFSDDFEPLMEYMPVHEYVATIKKCGYVIMNHVRQQAIGNIVIMLYLGARVFVRNENPAYYFFKAMGVTIFSIQDLHSNPKLLKSPLPKKVHMRNREIVSEYWARERCIVRTKLLLDEAACKKPRVGKFNGKATCAKKSSQSNSKNEVSL